MRWSTCTSWTLSTGDRVARLLEEKRHLLGVAPPGGSAWAQAQGREVQLGQGRAPPPPRAPPWLKENVTPSTTLPMHRRGSWF